MSKEALPELGVILSTLRLTLGWSQAQLGRAAGTQQINEYERGRKSLTRKRLEQLIAFMGLPPEAIDAALAFRADIRALTRSPLGAAEPLSAVQRRVEVVSARFARLAHGFARSTLTMLTTEGEALKARQHAEFLWGQLKKHTPANRRKLVERGARFRTWALCERVARESITAAPNQPQQALELAELALLIADRFAGEALWRPRLQGYAWAHVSNGRRVCNDLPGAEDAFASAKDLWEAGAAESPGFLNPAWLRWIEAALCREQRRFSESLKRINDALALDQEGELKRMILLSKSAIFQILGDPEGSAAALAEAAPLIDPDREPRNALVLRFNFLVDLCFLDRFAEAKAKLAEVRELAERLGEELDLTRVVWVTGKIAAGLGRTAEAQAAFEQARKVFSRRELTVEYALVSLELALTLLEQGRTDKTRTLAEEMLRIFRVQKVEREALAALQIFCDAARQETATVELTRRIVKFLYRAQHDPELRFESETRAEAR
ncbi:MAG TPA: helix-turn-helix transcriptional regulator [Thermoanaerobaculia bacterium]|jgi:transcriptional regulator with XRE-family HTH domain|nr:helix-turn-helix transcriptional regulator [Thermoanaerobaculia bacterium]